MSFDPRDTNAEPGTIRNAAGDLQAVSGSLTGHGEAVGAALRRPAKSFSDLIASKITSQANYNESACRTAVSGVVFGHAVTTGWAEDVDWFKRERQKLITQWNEASANGFGVQKPDMSKVQGNELRGYDAKVSDAKEKKLAELNKAAHDLWEKFQNKASDRGNELKSGPTPENLHKLDEAGLLPLSAQNLFGRGWEAARPHELLANMIDKGILPANFAGMSADEVKWAIEHDPALAKKLSQQAAANGTGDALMQAIWKLDHGKGQAGDVTGQLGKLSEGQRNWYALLAPGVFGAGSGLSKAAGLGSFDMRATSNRIRIVAALGDKNAEIPGLKDRVAKLQQQLKDLPYAPAGKAGDVNAAKRMALGHDLQEAKDALAAAEKRKTTFEGMLNDTRTNYGHLPGEPDKTHRKIVYFEPDKDGAAAELVGNINKDTENVGVHVPGTGTDLDKFGGVAKKAETFVSEADAHGKNLAMVAWMGADLPDSVPKDAPFVNYSEDGGKKLAGFSHELRHEMRNSIPDKDVPITVSGHSYGGAVVGKGEEHGMDANRVLHIESAGMGHNVDSPDDYHNPNKHVARYSMTAPDDPIGSIQGKNGPDSLGLGNMGHGADPDEFPGVQRLETGRFSDDPRYLPDGKKPGSVIGGDGVHSDVFSPRSDAWWNMYNVHTGGQVEVYQDPVEYDTGHGKVKGPERVETPDYKPKYEDVK
jgi:hypothetical protein